jgi:Holliday junction DNA helicase RuvA
MIAPSRGTTPWRAQVHAGLVNLGWSAKDADAAVDAVAADIGGQEPPDVATLLKSALKKLSQP